MRSLIALVLLLIFVAVSQASGQTCSGGNTCYYINDPCPSGTEDCSDQYSCSLDTNKCCCEKAPGCPDGWVEFQSLCYFYVNKGGMGMIQGQEECQQFGANLPVIKSATENQFLLSFVEDEGEAWLGMEASNSDNFTWVDGTSVGETFSAWAPGEPNYPGVDENCAYMYISGGKKGEWNNNPCDQPHHIVCQKQK